MRAPETLHATRVVAAPSVLDRLPTDGGTVLRFAPDEALVLDASVDAPVDGVTEDERGFVGWWLTENELAEVIHQVEWPIPEHRPTLAQGLVAGVPAKLWLERDRALLLCQAAFAHELVERLP